LWTWQRQEPANPSESSGNGAIVPDFASPQAGFNLYNEIIGTNWPAVTVAAGQNPSSEEPTFQATATVTTGQTGAIINPPNNPTDDVQFLVDGSNYGRPQEVVYNTSTIEVSGLSVGAHTLSAVYTSAACTSFGVSTSIDMITINVPPPTVTGLSTPFGSTASGTTVLITGDDLSNATSVLFGNLPAENFTVISNNAIVAVAPPQQNQTVDVIVMSGSYASSISSADRFTYRSTGLTYTVTSPGDSSGSAQGAGSGYSGDLRYCLYQAIQDQLPDLIEFDPTVFTSATTISLDPTLISMPQTSANNPYGTTAFLVGANDNITIDGSLGSGVPGITLNGNNATRLFVVEGGGSLQLQNLTLEGGLSQGGAGSDGIGVGGGGGGYFQRGQ